MNEAAIVHVPANTQAAEQCLLRGLPGLRRGHMNEASCFTSASCFTCFASRTCQRNKQLCEAGLDEAAAEEGEECAECSVGEASRRERERKCELN